MSYQRGDILLVPFPFTDLSRQKARPAVVISPLRFNQRFHDVILVAISSQIPEILDEFELEIRHGSAAFVQTGLRVNSVIKTAKLITMNQSLIYTTLGKLTAETMREVDQRIIRAVGLTK
jgi:mRNA interferase MazF